MRQDSRQIETLEELRVYVADTLGRLEMLKSDQFELTQASVLSSAEALRRSLLLTWAASASSLCHLGHSPEPRSLLRVLRAADA